MEESRVGIIGSKRADFEGDWYPGIGKPIMVSSQLVPKSTRTLVNSYPFLVNSYLTFGQLVPTPSQLVPESKNGAG